MGKTTLFEAERQCGCGDVRCRMSDVWEITQHYLQNTEQRTLNAKQVIGYWLLVIKYSA